MITWMKNVNNLQIAKVQAQGVCITASGNILVCGNLCFRVFKFQLKVINENVCYLHSAE